jgi:hypothetical protein
MAYEMAGRHISNAATPLHVATDAHADDPTYLELAPGGPNSMRPRKPQVKYHNDEVPLPDDHPAAMRGGSVSGRSGQ